LARTVIAGLVGQDSRKGPAGKGQPQQGSHNRAARMGETEREKHKMACRIGLPVQDCQKGLPEETTVRTGLPEEYC
jgi:hypothetical protein